MPLQDMGKPADVAGFHWRKRRVRKERSDGTAMGMRSVVGVPAKYRNEKCSEDTLWG